MVTLLNSYNGKIVLEAYEHTALRAENKTTFATLGQRNSLKGLKVLASATLFDGAKIPKGATAYIKEEFLHTSPSVKNKFKCDALAGEIILLNLSDIEFFSEETE